MASMCRPSIRSIAGESGGGLTAWPSSKTRSIQAGEQLNYSGQPYRWTGALEFNPTEFSRIRLQYNYDKSDPQKENQEIFLQFILAIGTHGAHAY